MLPATALNDTWLAVSPAPLSSQPTGNRVARLSPEKTQSSVSKLLPRVLKTARLVKGDRHENQTEGPSSFSDGWVVAPILFFAELPREPDKTAGDSKLSLAGVSTIRMSSM